MVGEALIVGGGLSGGAAAVRLARAGRPVRLIEREAGPRDKVCGEFLSVEARAELASLGLDPLQLGGVVIDRVRLVARGREAEARLPFVAMGLSRRVLDEALLDDAAAVGARIERGVRVRSMADGVAQTHAGERRGDPVLIATGKHALRGTPRAGDPAASGYVGFKLHWRLSPDAARRLAGWIELLPFAGGYAGLQLVAADTANLCLIVRARSLAADGGWEGLLKRLREDPAFDRRLGDATPVFARPMTIANLPYGHVGGAVGDGVFRLGDQAAMTASLTGDGMAGALVSARMAAESVLAGESAEAFQARFARTVQRQVSRAMLLQRATEWPLAMRLAMTALRLRPRLLGALASATRLPYRAAQQEITAS